MKYGSQSMVGKMGSVLVKPPQNAFISQENLKDNLEKYNYINLQDYEESLKEYEKFLDILEEEGIEVYKLPQDDRTGLDSIYSHDSLKVTKKGAIYFNLGKELRRGEGQATEDYLETLGIPTLGHVTSPGLMEGGDVVWLDEKTVAIADGYRTNSEGIRQFKEITKDIVDEVIVVPLPYGDGPDECLHLMSIISMVDDDLAVVYSEYMPVFFRRILEDRGIELLEVDRDEYDNLGSNVLALAPRVCLMLEGNPKIEQKLKDAGCKVYTYKGQEISYQGTGGPTCLTHPLYRD